LCSKKKGSVRTRTWRRRVEQGEVGAARKDVPFWDFVDGAEHCRSREDDESNEEVFDHAKTHQKRLSFWQRMVRNASSTQRQRPSASNLSLGFDHVSVQPNM